MKKIFAILLAAAMLFALAACGSKPSQGSDSPLNREDGGSQSSTPASESQPTTNPTGGYDPNTDLKSQLDSLNKNNLTPEMIAQIEADAKKDGYEVKWGADGSMTIVEDGRTVSLSGDWPDNEYTKLIPKPTAGTIAATEIAGNECSIIMSWTVEEAKQYASDIKNAGFNKNVDEQDMADMKMYVFTAENNDGVMVSVSFMSSTGGITIAK